MRSRLARVLALTGVAALAAGALLVPQVAQAVPRPASASLPAAGAVAQAAVAPAYDVLVFSKTAGFRHDSIPEGIAAIQQLGARNGFSVTATEDATAFTAANLAQYEAVVWLSTTMDVLNDSQQAAFETYIKAGGGYVGIHAASDTEYTWPWYGKLVGAYFRNHPSGTPTADVLVENKETPSSCFLPTKWTRDDEWYNYQGTDSPYVGGNDPTGQTPDVSPRPGVNVIATVDENSYNEDDGSAAADDHPVAWWHEFDGGRSWYTGMGHSRASFSEPLFQLHLLGGIQYAADQAPTGCAEKPPVATDFEQVTLAKGVDKVGEPMSISVLPDGRVLHNARDGRVFLTDLDGNTKLAATIPVYNHDEDGLQNVQISPDFANDKWVYVYYGPPLNTPSGDAPMDGPAGTWDAWQGHNQLSRFKFVDDKLDLASEQRLLQVPADRGICCHAGGGIDFDAQGNLYLSTGDDSYPHSSSGFTPIDERATRNPAMDAQRSSGNTNDLRGKVIRIKPHASDPSYSIPAGNLFPEGTAKTKPEIYAMGFRNPFRLSVDKETGWVYVGEYGPDAGAADSARGPGGLVEFNQIREAGNFGWPYCVGANTNAQTYRDFNFATDTSGPAFDCANPVNDSPRNTGLTNLPPAKAAWMSYDGDRVTYDGRSTNEFGGGGEAPMAGPVYRFDPDLQSDVKMPKYYDGKFIVGEFGRQWTKTITMNDTGDAIGVESMFNHSAATPMYAPMDYEIGPDGSLYFLDYGNGGYFRGNENSALYKFNFTGGLRSPSAVAKADVTSGPAPLTVKFSSAGSTDADGDDITFAWDFDGDGTTDATDPNPTHTYAEVGQYDAKLTVTDSTNRRGSATVVITTGNTRPKVTIESPPNGSFFNFGDTVRVKSSVVDPDEASIDCQKVKVNFILGHDAHSHGLGEAGGCDTDLNTEIEGGHGADANVFGVVGVGYTDSGGAGGVNQLEGSATSVLQPKRKQAEHYTEMSGLQTETTTDATGGNVNLSYIDNGDWASYNPINLVGIDTLRFRVASGGSGGNIEVRLDSPTGTLVGTAPVAVTGDWQNWTTTQISVPASAQAAGTHTMYFVFTGPGDGLFNLNYFEALGKGASTNSPPTVNPTATPADGEAPLAVAFDAGASDPDGDALTYAWDFGVAGTDADAATVAKPSYTYAAPGTYTAKVTVTDAKGRHVTASVVVRAKAPCGTGVASNDDAFDGSAIELCRWDRIVREDISKYRVSGGALSVTTTRGDIHLGGNSAEQRNIFLQKEARATAEDFSIETKLSGTISDQYAQGGPTFYGDDDNYLKFVVQATPDAGRINVIQLSSESNAAQVGNQINLDAPANVTSYRLRLTKKGNAYTGQVSFDGADWVTVGTVTHPRTDLDFGLLTVGYQQPDRVIDYDSFEYNVAPTAKADSVTARAGRPTTVDVAGNDMDLDGDTLSVSSAGTPAHGTATVTDGVLSYTPEAGYVGLETFEYVVADGKGGTATGTVNIVVTANARPAATEDTASTPKGKAVDILVLANDTDPEGDTLSVDSVGTPGHGTAAAQGDGSVRYTPEAGFVGTDHFTYTVSDGNGGTDTATVIVTVTEDASGGPVPDTAIAGGPDGPTRNGWTSFTLTSTVAGATFECSLDGAAYIPCSSPVSFDGLRDGEHRLLVRAVSKGGTDESPALRVWTVDSTAPVVRKVKPIGKISQRRPKVIATVTDRGTGVALKGLTVTVDGRRVKVQSFNPTTGKLVARLATKLRSGQHMVAVTAVDAVGNRATTRWRFKVR